MWIRTDDREELINTNRIYYSDVDKSLNSDCSVLGMYSSKEKALKVLDMIQNEIIRDDSIPFVMPADEDVKV